MTIGRDLVVIFYTPMDTILYYIKKGGQVGTAMLFSSCNRCFIFEYNDKPLYTKNDSEWLA